MQHPNDQNNTKDFLAPTIIAQEETELLDASVGWCIGIRGEHLMRLNTDKHMITIAYGGDGKRIRTIIPNMLRHEGSALSTEVGGATYRSTVNFRRTALKQKIRIIDPFGITGEVTDHINLLDTLEDSSPNFLDDVKLFAESLLKSDSDPLKQNIYYERAPRRLLMALLLYVKTSPEVTEEDRNLVYLSELLRDFPSAEWQSLMKKFSLDKGKYSAILNSVGNYYSLYNDDDYDYHDHSWHISTLISCTQESVRFTQSPALAAMIKKSTFSLKELSGEKSTIYVVLPEIEDYRAHAPFLRLLIDRSLSICPNLGEEGPSSKNTHDRILFMLDSFTELGKLDALDIEMETASKKGITVWAVLQDTKRLQPVYGKDLTSSFLTAAGCIQALSIDDPDSLLHVRELLGKHISYIPQLKF